MEFSLATDITRRERRHLRVTVQAGETSEPIYLPVDSPIVTISVRPSVGASATVEHAVDSRELVEANDPGVTWEPSTVVNTTTTISETIEAPITAIRLIATGGPATLVALAAAPEA